MNDEVMTEAVEINGKEYYLLDKVDKYYFFSEVNKIGNICILKEQVGGEDSDLVNLKDNELNEALKLFCEKYSDDK